MSLVLLQKSFVTATQTRRKQQQMMIKRALMEEEGRRLALRQNFPISSAPSIQLAAYEPALYHTPDEHDDG